MTRRIISVLEDAGSPASAPRVRGTRRSVGETFKFLRFSGMQAAPGLLSERERGGAVLMVIVKSVSCEICRFLRVCFLSTQAVLCWEGTKVVCAFRVPAVLFSAYVVV